MVVRAVCTASDKWRRLAGSSRYGTAALIADEGFADGSCPTVILARGDDFPDALAASSLAGALGCPVLTTPGSELADEAAAEIVRLGAKKVYVLGGTGSVFETTVSDVEALGCTTVRVAGAGRAATSVQIARYAKAEGASSDSCVITKGWAYADALAIAPYCYASGSPVFLANGDGTISDEVAQAVADGGYTKAIVLGGDEGQGCISDASMDALPVGQWIRIAGASRYDTAEQIALWSCGKTGYSIQPAAEDMLSFDRMAVARGDDFPDALASVDMLGPSKSALLLVAHDATDQDTHDRIDRVIGGNRESISGGYLLGGTGSVDETVERWVNEASE